MMRAVNIQNYVRIVCKVHLGNQRLWKNMKISAHNNTHAKNSVYGKSVNLKYTHLESLNFFKTVESNYIFLK